MYSAKIDGKPTTFGTSGLLYRSNKLMYDRTTGSLWRQFTGEPVIGTLAERDIRLEFFPVLLTNWKEWESLHPETTVLDINTSVYWWKSYQPESDPGSNYHEYFKSPDTMFPVWNRSDALKTKQMVLGIIIGESPKAYPISDLHQQRLINDIVGGKPVVVITSASSQAVRVYERGSIEAFFTPESQAAGNGLPSKLKDQDGGMWTVTEDHLVSDTNRSLELKRVPTRLSFWFGWFSSYPDTDIYTLEAR